MNKKWFTLVEIVIVMVILALLSTISVLSFSNYMKDTRDSKRQIDIAALESALRLFKKQNNFLPEPSLKENLNLNWSTIWYQGDAWAIPLNTIKEVPKDPKTEKNYYYSILKENDNFPWEFQVGWTLEKNLKAIVKWDYDPVLSDFPWIIFKNVENKDTVVLDNQNKNILNDFRGWYKMEWLSAEEKNMAYRHPYKTCEEIKNNNKFVKAWTYKLFVSNNNYKDEVCN